jgi:hypothetical protein
MGLKIENARGQCYDGANVMSGHKNGVAAKIKEINQTCLYTHCYGHSLNLAVSDTIKGVKHLTDTFEMIRAICKLIKKSPKRETQLKNIKEKAKSQAKGIHTVCPTRWTVRGEACAAIISNYEYLVELWEWSLSSGNPDSDTRAKILGAQSAMQSFSFLFGTHLNKRVLVRTDVLAKNLQGFTVSAAEGAEYAKVVKEQLADERNDEEFNRFWEEVLLDQAAFNVSEATTPRVIACQQRITTKPPTMRHTTSSVQP